MPRKIEPLPEAPLPANDWLKAHVKTSNVPDWLLVPPLPGVRWNDGSPAFLDAILVLASSKKSADKETYDALVGRFDSQSLSELAWPMFRRWMETGFPTRHRWVMDFLADHGDELAMLQLGELARRWPTQGKIAKSKQAIAVFQRNGSMPALAQLDDLADMARQPSLRDAAREALEEAAHARGVSVDDIIDQLTPTGGLDERGTLTLDLGSRSFVASLRPDMSLVLKDSTGKIVRSLPKASTKDDPAKASRSAEIFKAAKKQIKDLGQRLAKRLEMSMIKERVWPIDRWRSTFLAHPILRFVAQRIIWTSIHPAASGETLFRVSEDLTLADETDREWELPAEAMIGISHPLFWSDASKKKWSEIFEDYNIEPAFPQAARECYSISPEFEHQTSIETYRGVQVDARRLALLSRRDGWTASTPMDGGVFYAFFRSFRPRELTAILFHTGIFAGGFASEEDVTIENLVFAGTARDRLDIMREVPADWLPIVQVPPIAFSETIRDIQRIAAHAMDK